MTKVLAAAAGDEFINVRYVGKGAVVRALSSIRDAMTRQSTLQMIAEEAVALIKARTLEGLDTKDRPLIPSKRAERDDGQTLSDKGHMLGALGVQRVSPKKATLGFGNQIEAKKAWWAQDGTKPHVITAAPGHALAFAGGSYQNAFRIASKKMGARYFSAGSYSASAAMRAGKSVTGMTILHSVNHPGTPKRPFFGISPRDAVDLQTIADDYIRKAVRAAEASA